MSVEWWGIMLTVAGLVFAAGGTMWAHRDHSRRLGRLEEWREEWLAEENGLTHEERLKKLEHRTHYQGRCISLMIGELHLSWPPRTEGSD